MHHLKHLLKHLPDTVSTHLKNVTHRFCYSPDSDQDKDKLL